MALLPVETALERLLAGAAPGGDPERVDLRQAFGRVLAQDVAALRTQPGFDASAMDGYALRAADVEIGRPMRVIGLSAAGRAFVGEVGEREAVRIFTGAPLPAGADAVLMQENVESGDEGFVVPQAVASAREHIRRAGNDFSEGDVLLKAGTRMGAGAVALAASGGHPSLLVHRKPKVAVLATGDELVEPGDTVGPSQIVASNSYGVAALVEANGGTVVELAIAPDEVETIAGRIDEARNAGAEIFVSIGGASVGDHDLTARAFELRGAEQDFWKVAMRPGKPIMAGRIGEMRLVGLPGNPASSMVAATIFLRPLLRLMAGLDAGNAWLHGRLGADVGANDHRAEFVRSSIALRADGELPIISPLQRQDSSLLSIYAHAEVLLFRPAHAPAGRTGEECRYLLLD